MRTLVLGIPLPHVTFDNYSFLSAPSLFDYERVIVDTAALSEAVQQVLDGSQEHRTHGGQTILNGPADHRTFSLAELLRLRRLEAERLIARGGAVVCFAHPDAAHEGIDGLPAWRRFDWLPAPAGFAYAEHLLPGYGKLGVHAVDGTHPLAPFVEEFGSRLGFRAYVPDEALAGRGRVFARSPGGAAVGVELDVAPGRVVLIPPLTGGDVERDRGLLAAVLYGCLERLRPQSADQPSQLIRKEAS